MTNAVVGPVAGPLTQMQTGVTPEQQRMYQNLKDSSGLSWLIPGMQNTYSDAAFNKAFQGSSYTPEDLFKLTGGDDRGVSAGEWSRLAPDLQKSILSDPGTFLRGQFGRTEVDPNAAQQVVTAKYLRPDGTPITDDSQVVFDQERGRMLTEVNGEYVDAVKNPHYGDKTYLDEQLKANPLAQAGYDPQQWKTYTRNGGGSGDLLSVGAEGGIRNYDNVKWVPGVGLVHPNQDYMQVIDQDENIGPAIIMGIATGGLGALAAPTLGALGSTALTAGINAANASIDGRNPWQAALGSFLGYGVNQAAGNFLPKDMPSWASSAIKGGASSALSGLASGKGVDLASILANAAGAGVGSQFEGDYAPLARGALSKLFNGLASGSKPTSTRQPAQNSLQQRLAAAKAYYNQSNKG